MHSFRPQATTKSGHLIFKKQYSNRTKNWHPEPFRAEKTHHYIQFLMASILKARVDDKESAARVISLPSDHPRNLAPTIVLRESPELIYSRIIEADLTPKKSEDSVKPVFWVLIRGLAYVLFIIVEGTRYRHTVTWTVWFRCPKNFKSKFIHYIIIHWLMHAVTMKLESLHKKNYFWMKCYVHYLNIIYTVFQWNFLTLEWIEYF